MEKEVCTKNRTLEELCQGKEFQTEIQGNKYCSLNLSSEIKVKCLFLSSYLDHNKLPVCLYQKCIQADYDLE